MISGRYDMSYRRLLRCGAVSMCLVCFVSSGMQQYLSRPDDANM